jgi:hypothetical protein
MTQGEFGEGKKIGLVNLEKGEWRFLGWNGFRVELRYEGKVKELCCDSNSKWRESWRRSSCLPLRHGRWRRGRVRRLNVIKLDY